MHNFLKHAIDVSVLIHHEELRQLIECLRLAHDQPFDENDAANARPQSVVDGKFSEIFFGRDQESYSVRRTPNPSNYHSYNETHFLQTSIICVAVLFQFSTVFRALLMISSL